MSVYPYTLMGFYFCIIVLCNTDNKAYICFKQLLFGADIWLIVNLVTFAVYAYMMVLMVIVFY